MPEANVLYSVTAATVLGLVVWVAVVLMTAKEPWARPVRAAEVPPDVPLEPTADAAEKAPLDESASDPTGPADRS